MNTTIRTQRHGLKSILVSAAVGMALVCSTTVSGAAESGADAVRCVQKQFNALGFEVGVVDGVVGVKTFLASEAYTRFLGANGEGGSVRTPLSARSAREWCEMLADDDRKVATYWQALQDSEMPADPKAVFDRAYGFDTGIGARKDEVLAVRWYLRAATLGYAPAQRNLAGMYGSGRGVPMSADAARYWFTAAARQGDAQAQFVLGNAYTANAQASLNWLWKAAKQGHPGAIAALDARLGT